ncbi:MAG: aquaporin [Phycisphaerales bacterium]|nr:aquaporin [Phycisphaerales bacterium]
MNRLVQGCIAEFLGTFALVFFGAASIIIAASPAAGAQPVAPTAGLVTVALAHGLILAVFVSACMYISGAQFNPAVSIGLVVAGKQSPVTAGAYIASQLAAASLAAGALVFFLGDDLAIRGGGELGATIGRFTKEENVLAVVGIEAIMTFALMFVILGAVVDERAHKFAGAQVGMVVAACIVAAGPLTGASMNPARTFGPALVGGFWEMHWAYWVAPVLGASLAALVYKAVWMSRPRPAA